MVRENALEQGQGRSREIVLFGLFTALIAIGAFIRIPVPVCPFTLQLLFTTLAGLLLGSRKGALSVALYVLLGLVGVPVFTEGGGPSYIFQAFRITSFSRGWPSSFAARWGDTACW